MDKTNLASKILVVLGISLILLPNIYATCEYSCENTKVFLGTSGGIMILLGVILFFVTKDKKRPLK